ncbi:hypothetical protein COU78_07020 [Candidatus Peregrinibacteria bacterium CG10_big_fil_rev_8_21_14_0_10_49_24]|nr:MAG: hypothetical protein COV83_05890 [Candidatus Peregrinibacteria bacterium CG11_big_fil_rev_8_21_14_0_20_49_14]PIR50353.1 MAG: hypothetical protein COU78_07020 [Candidatus Peregrinibacteria bacterium CG10_big_fil_rev_8_21_14_0_10_49_24]PJA67767.1 MAG: hypothetical protein CO157_02760 [Candidatus Peregrinibacteria bacterium CG_4_9_14_3_um_filter_49_12]
MEHVFLSPERRIRVLSTAIAAAVALYAVVAIVAEPIRALGASSDSETAVVQIAISSGIGINCDADAGGAGSGETLALTGFSDSGDTGELNSSVTVGTNAVRCNVRTNNSAGYDLAWKATSGSGGASTGYMINQFEDTLTPFRYTQSDGTTAPTAWNATSVPSTVAAWGGRLADSSAGYANSPITWGADASSNEKWMGVASGSTVTIARENAETVDAGSNNDIGFRVAVGGDKIQPSGTYQTTVTFTATVQ